MWFWRDRSVNLNYQDSTVQGYAQCNIWTRVSRGPHLVAMRFEFGVNLHSSSPTPWLYTSDDHWGHCWMKALKGRCTQKACFLKKKLIQIYLVFTRVWAASKQIWPKGGLYIWFSYVLHHKRMPRVKKWRSFKRAAHSVLTFGVGGVAADTGDLSWCASLRRERSIWRQTPLGGCQTGPSSSIRGGAHRHCGCPGHFHRRLLHCCKGATLVIHCKICMPAKYLLISQFTTVKI